MILLRRSKILDIESSGQQIQLVELYNTYLSLYWQSVSQSEELDLDPRLLNLVGITAPPPAAATGVPPAADNYPPPEAYLEVLWGLLTCLLHSFLIIAILNFYGSLKFVLGFTFACLIFLGQVMKHICVQWTYQMPSPNF